jgi:lipopolysaccharide export system permease protein
MIIKTYVRYIVKEYLLIFLNVTMVFYSLIFILNIFEELSFFKNVDTNFLFPIFLTFLNVPSILYDIFPFIFLISTQFYFIKVFEKNELIIFKNFGLSNIKILKILILSALIFGMFIIFVFYNFSSKAKKIYLNLKNEYTLDNRYLAVITENGLWIKDEINESILIVNAVAIDGNYLTDVSIVVLSKDYDLIRNIEAQKIDITKLLWKATNVKIHKNNITIEKDELELETHFNLEKINNLFSNLSSLTMWELVKLKKDYKSLGYSTSEIDNHQHKIITYPIYLMIMVLLSSIIMFNIKTNKTRVFNIILGISLSVIIYYIRYFFNLLGENNQIPIIMSIWFPLIIMLILCSIGMVRINEK